MSETSAPPPKKTLRDHLRALAGALLVVGFTFILIEGMLRVVDPWGLSYFADLGYMGNELFTLDEQRGYSIPDGTYQFSNWRATIQDGGRILPADHPNATCEIILLGDSVTFGYGVNDEQTWANLIAQMFPQVHFYNSSVPVYNSTNVALTFATFPQAHAYLYMAINNDLDPAIDLDEYAFTGSGGNMPYLVRYVNFAIFRGYNTDRISAEGTETLPITDTRWQRWRGEIDPLLVDGRVTLAALRGEVLTNTLLANNYPVNVVVYPADKRNSVADYHLNPAGNQLLAEQLQPIVQEMVNAHCP